ncbi:MAG TPA: choice-of-anchor tandem repeat GloVer-containing protein [Rhizomicrobium sp.]
MTLACARAFLGTAILAVATAAGPGAAEAKGFKVLYSFAGGPGDGANPTHALLRDKDGNLYGTTDFGGTSGYGTVFKLAPDGTESILLNFDGADGGGNPLGGLYMDKKGALYGSTVIGGTNGGGVIFKLSHGKETEYPLYHLTGTEPMGSLIAGANGVLYGTAWNDGLDYAGTVTELELKSGLVRPLYFFTNYNDGFRPLDGLIADKHGILYGTTSEGGTSENGTVFKCTPMGIETDLYNFTGGSDGGDPAGALVSDSGGNLYGTTNLGGANSSGVVFKLAPDGTETVLHDFAGGKDGANPAAGLVRDAKGNLYGTTQFGGHDNAGVVFRLAPNGKETILEAFKGSASPDGALIDDGQGHLFGTTLTGGTSNNGMVFEIDE